MRQASCGSGPAGGPDRYRCSAHTAGRRCTFLPKRSVTFARLGRQPVRMDGDGPRQPRFRQDGRARNARRLESFHPHAPISHWCQLVRHGVCEGERNNTIVSLAGNHIRCRPPLLDEEVAAVVQSIARYADEYTRRWRTSQDLSRQSPPSPLHEAGVSGTSPLAMQPTWCAPWRERGPPSPTSMTRG